MTAINTEVLVLGGGPGGYTAAFRAADLGKQVTLVERYPVIGGVCLNVGCIPSKALLHMAQIIHEVEEVDKHGISYGKPKFDLDKIRSWKESVSNSLNTGLAGLCKQRNICMYCDGHEISHLEKNLYSSPMIWCRPEIIDHVSALL